MEIDVDSGRPHDYKARSHETLQGFVASSNAGRGERTTCVLGSYPLFFFRVNPDRPQQKGRFMAFSNRKPSRKLTFKDAVEIQRRLKKGEFQNRIAADYDVNPGRISEIKTGKAFPDSAAAV